MPSQDRPPVVNLYQVAVRTLAGERTTLADHEDTVLLIVNVASKCSKIASLSIGGGATMRSSIPITQVFGASFRACLIRSVSFSPTSGSETLSLTSVK